MTKLDLQHNDHRSAVLPAQAIAGSSDDRSRARVRRLRRPQELILTFHGIGEPPRSVTDAERRVWVPLEWFEAIVDSLHPRVRLAFDDGNTSDVEHALPALVERGISARFFPLAARLEAAGFLSAEDLTKLTAAGMQIGSQGMRHRAWRTVSDEELLEELTASRRVLAAIVDRDVTEAACPFGSYDRRVLRALHVAGYHRVFNSDGGMSAVGSWLSARTTVHQGLPLAHWLKLAARGGDGGPGPVALGKRLVKRLR